MDKPVTVIVIESLSYTGTTWLNYVLGSHPEVFSLGPADRPFALPHDQAHAACRVHGEKCPFWPRFYETWTEGKNFFVHLAETSSQDIIVTNNPLPTGAGTALDHPQVVVKRIRFVRDGRAVAESFNRKYPDRSFFDVVRDWLAPSFNNFAFDPADPDTLCLRYEDVLADQPGMLETVGGFIGLGYDESALRFWEHEHHPAAGNSGPIMMIRKHQGEPLPKAARDKAFYEDQYRKTIENPNHRFESNTWHERLSPRERFIFDIVSGEKNASLGYERDRFTLDEVRQFSREFDLAMGLPTDAEPEPAAKTVENQAQEPIQEVAPPSEPAAPLVEPTPSRPPEAAPHSGSGGTVIAVVAAATILGVVSILAATGVL
jgi:hypothetical protein